MENIIKNRILEFSAFGRGANGINRIFGSQYYHEAALKMRDYMIENGMKSWIDSVGNVHGIYPSNALQLPSIIIGSHLDTVKGGGMFDGLLGVLAAIECVKRLQKEHGKLKYSIHVIATNGEEGNDLGGTFGSRCLVGNVDISLPGFLDKAKKYNLTEDDIRKAKMDFSKAVCYLELHIEQGKTLFESGENIGIVTGIVGLQRYEITVNGKSNHAGTTMMEYRKDALVGAAKIITLADRLARDYGHNLVATFNRIEVSPNVIAVISSKVRMILEFRNQNKLLMEKYIQEVQEHSKKIADVAFSPVVKKSPVDCDPKIVDAIQFACSRMNLKYRKMPSGATHDGNMMALKVPIGMIFVPSKDGISHSKDEWTDWEQCEKGTEVLYQTVLKLEGIL